MNEKRRKEIDDYLRKITESEKNNLLGNYSSFSALLPDKPAGSSNHNTIKYIPIFFPNMPIQLKKNSRFRNIDEHSHDYIEIGYIYSGTVTETINGKPYTFHQGQMIMIDRNTIHSIGYTEENDILVSIIAPIKYCQSALSKVQTDNILLRFFLNALNDENKGINYLIFNAMENDRTQEMMMEMIYEQIYPSQNHNEIMESLFETIILSVMSTIDTQPVIQNLDKSSALTVKAITFIEEHYKDCTLQTVADHLGLNAAYLSTLLKKEIGRNFRDIVSEKKLRYASELLRTTNLPVSVIAETCGYPNFTLFYKKFQSQYHCKPGEYRKAIINQEETGI